MLNKKALGIEGGAIYRVRYPAIGSAKITKIAMEEYTIESVIRGHHVYKSIWHPILGEQLTLEREDSNSHDRHAVSVMKGGAIASPPCYNSSLPSSTLIRQKLIAQPLPSRSLASTLTPQ